MSLPPSPPSSCPLWTGSEITQNQWWDSAPPGWASHELASRFKGLCHHSKLRYNKGPMKVTVELLVPQSCLTLCDPMDCGPPGSSVDGILQARILEWVATSFSRGTSRPRHGTRVSCITGRSFLNHGLREAPVGFNNPGTWRPVCQVKVW